MRKRQVSHEELSHIIRLRQGGASWSRIEVDAKVPRRAARRAYEEWQHSQSTEDLKAARIHVATEEFGRHLDSLVLVAEALMDRLEQPIVFYQKDSAEDWITGAWNREIYPAPGPHMPFEDRPAKEQQRMARNNELLFRSLLSHTAGHVRWDALKEWELAWDNCLRALDSLHTDARASVSSFLKQDRPTGKTQGDFGPEEPMIQEMAKGVVESIWRGALEGNLEPAEEIIHTATPRSGVTQVSFGEPHSISLVETEDAGLADHVCQVCRTVTKNIRIEHSQGGTVAHLKQGMETMVQSARELSIGLVAPVLRPAILRTHCDICPA